MRTAPPTAIPTMIPVDREPAPGAPEVFTAVLSSVGEDFGTSSKVAVLGAVIRVPLVVDAVSIESEVVVDGLAVMMVVCLVIVTIELFGIVWVMPESVMVTDFFVVAVDCDEVVDSVCRL